MKFVPVDGAGHFGYIEHVPSGKIVHPKGGKPNPRNTTALVYHSDRHYGALFTFDEENKRIIHKGGKLWHPKSGSLSPSNDTTCVLHSDVHNAAKFYFGDINGRPISPYPEKIQLSGNWKIIEAFKDPEASFSGTYMYKIGKSLSRSVFDINAWNMEGKDVRTLFEVEEKYCRFVEKADSRTWSAETEETGKFNAHSKTTLIWQYVFAISQYDEECLYRSSIIGETSSLDEEPF